MGILSKFKQLLSDDASKLLWHPHSELSDEAIKHVLISSFEAAQNHAYLNVYTTGLTKKQLDVLVTDHWGIKDKQGALEILNQLLKRNRNRNLKAIYTAYEIVDYPDYLKYNLHEDEEEIVKQYIAYFDRLRAEVPTLLEHKLFADYQAVKRTEDAGWNLGRGAFLIRACLDLQLLSTEEAEVLLKRFYDELRKHCNTWEEYMASYILGARIEGWLPLEELLQTRQTLVVEADSSLKKYILPF